MLTVKARGKINWCLKITGKRADHYHLLDTVMQSISLFDLLTFTPTPEPKVILTLEDFSQPLPPKDNLVYKAATLLSQTFGLAKGVHIHLKKNIPAGAGLGGGSADAAATFVALNRLWSLSLTNDELMKIALPLGADIPFCINGGLQHAQGIGEALTPYPINKTYHLVIIKPLQNLNTKGVFTSFSFKDPAVPYDQSPLLIKALQEEDFPGIKAHMQNDLQAVSSLLCSDIHRALEDLTRHGALKALMTGSGSAVIGLFPSQEKAQQSFEVLRYHWQECFIAHTLTQGLTFIS